MLVYGAFFCVVGNPSACCCHAKRDGKTDTQMAYAWFPAVFCLSGSVVCGLGIAQYFLADPFGWLGQIQEFERRMFYSTIGYSNFYSCYAGLVAAVSMGMYGVTQEKWNVCWLFPFFLACMALLTSSSDGGFLALGAAYLAMPFLLWAPRYHRRSHSSIKRAALPQNGCYRHLLLGGVFMAAVCLTGFWNNGRYVPVRELNPGLAVRLMNGFFSLAAALALFAGSGLLAVLEHRMPKKKIVTYYCVGLLVVVAAALLGLVGTGRMASLLCWGPQWGTGRGMIWSVALEEWQALDWIHRLFGNGPDTAGLLLASRQADFVSVLGYGDINHVHNELLQYLITLGVAGVLAYLAFLAACLRQMWRQASRCPWKCALLLGVLAYLAQSVISINQSVTTPWLFLFLALGVCENEPVISEMKNWQHP